MLIRTFVPPQPLRITALGSVLLDPRWSVTLRADYWRIYRNRSQGGEMRFTGPGADLVPDDGRVVVVPPWSPWSATCTGPVDHVYIQVEAGFLPREWLQAELSTVVVLAVDPQRDGLLDALRTLPLGPTPVGLQLRLQALVAVCLDEVLGGLGADARQRLASLLAVQDPLAPALARLATALAAPLDLDALAACCGMKRHRFAHLFRERMKTTPGRWQMERRVAAAAEQLISTDDPIELISARVGFANRHHFTRVFTRMLEQSPAAYRALRQFSRQHPIRRLRR